MPQTSTTQRIVSAYAQEEPWKEQHDRAMYCHKLEDSLKWGLTIFTQLKEIEAGVQTRAMKTEEAVDEEAWKSFVTFYEIWAQVSRHHLAEATKLAVEGFEIEKLEELELAIEEAEAMIGSSAIEPELMPIEEQLKMLRPDNPRPDRYND